MSTGRTSTMSDTSDAPVTHTIYVTHRVVVMSCDESAASDVGVSAFRHSYVTTSLDFTRPEKTKEMRPPKQPSDVASDVTGDTTPTPKGKTDPSRIVAHLDGTPGKPNPNPVRITTATHTGQGRCTFGGITHVHATPAPTSGLRGTSPTPFRTEQARKQPDLVAAPASGYE